MLMKTTVDFVNSPLVVWAKCLLDLTNETVSFDRFPNGEYFYLILKNADPRLQNLMLPNEGELYDTTRSRLLNLDFILRNIRSFYQHMFNHVLLIKLPDIYQIAKHPESEETFREMEKVLLLLLGIAINGDNKEKFVEQIQNNLDTQIQLELVPYIKLVNDDISFSISKSIKLDLDESDSTIDKSLISDSIIIYKNIDDLNYFLLNKLMPNVQRIVDERDSYLESIIELEQDKDYLNYKIQCSLDSNCTHQSTEQLDSDANSNNINIDSLKNSGDNGSSSLINLSDTQTLFMLFESIYKEINVNKHEHGKLSDMIGNQSNDIISEKEEFFKNSAKHMLNNSNWNQKIAIELVECKIKLKQLINEVEEKCEQIESLKDEIDDVKKQINKLRNENVDLQQKAALAQVYSDELESLREKSSKADKYETEMNKLKEKLDELQMSKARLDELKEENLILSETRTIMEKQIHDYQVKLLSLQRADTDMNKYKLEIDDLLNQRELDKKRLCELCEKNAKLELDMKNLLNQNVIMDKELNNYKQELTLMSLELNQKQILIEQSQQLAQQQHTQIKESNKFRQNELEHLVKELKLQLSARDQELSKLKDSLRHKETSLDEYLAKIKVLNKELTSEQESRIKAEKNLEQHKNEIKDLQLRLDDCVNETKKLDQSIRAAAESNDQKETETKENLKKLLDSHEQLNQSYKTLLVDHENLQKIYLQLESDYEEIYAELNQKHSVISNLKTDLETTSEKLKNITNRAKSEKSSSTDDLIDLEKQALEEKIKKLNQEIQILDQNSLTLDKQIQDQRIENSKQKDQNNLLQIQLGQLGDKLRVYESLNDKLEEEKTQLFEQLHILVQQNQEILVQTLNSKDMYHEETKAYLQQLNNLKRQKEILEQKIMEQYKSPQKQKTPKKVDVFSKTRQFVNKVRNKSNLDNSVDLSEDSDRQTYCHKYSADDINYLNIKPKDSGVIKCLSSSSSSSSTSSNYEKPIEVKTPIKIDPKSLKLGGRPQSICSSSCSSPVSQTQSIISSPSIVTIKPPEFKRNLITSSPKFTNSSPSSSSTSSCSSSSSVKQNLVQCKSPIAVITKKPNSIQLIQSGRTKITSKIADSLKQFRLSAELDQIETCQIRDDDDDDDVFSDEEYAKQELAIKGKLNQPTKANEIWL
ncbi:unnamed protein product, partial [Brachionus calyciflorus]